MKNVGKQLKRTEDRMYFVPRKFMSTRVLVAYQQVFVGSRLYREFSGMHAIDLQLSWAVLFAPAFWPDMVRSR